MVNSVLQSVASGSLGVDAAHRDNRAQAILEEVLERPKSIIRALAGNAFPEAPAHIHVDAYGHHYQQWVPKVVVTQQDEGSLQSITELDNRFQNPITKLNAISLRHCQLWQNSDAYWLPSTAWKPSMVKSSVNT